jgi:hypothetical protein
VSIACITDPAKRSSPGRIRSGLLVSAALVAEQLARPPHDPAVGVNVDDPAGSFALQVRSLEPEPRRAAHARALAGCSLSPLRREGDQCHAETIPREEVISVKHHEPKGPDGLWKTGQRVPFAGFWTDQYGEVTHHEVGATFPPCIDRKGECAYRYLVEQSAATG